MVILYSFESYSTEDKWLPKNRKTTRWRSIMEGDLGAGKTHFVRLG